MRSGNRRAQTISLTSARLFAISYAAASLLKFGATWRSARPREKEQIFYGEFDGRRKKRALVKIIGE